MVLQLLLRREEDGVEARERVRRGAGLDSTAFVHCGRWTQPHATFHTKLLQGLRWDTHHQNEPHGCDVSALPPPEAPPSHTTTNLLTLTGILVRSASCTSSWTHSLSTVLTCS